MYNIYEDEDSKELKEIFESHETLREKRLSKTVYLPDILDAPVYNPDPQDLKEILKEYKNILDSFPMCSENLDPSRWEIKGVEVGDDRTDVSNSKEASALLLTVQEGLMGMLTSKEDTGISCDTWNLAEVTTGTPCSRSTMYNHARKRDNFKNLDFIDAPPLRTVIDTTKVDRIHSTSYIGKSRILGAKMRSSNAICTSHLAVANLFQDACLASWRGPEPKYLPSTLGGCHCPDAYSDPANTYLFMKAFRGGGYDRLYGTAVEEAITAIKLNENNVPTSCIISEVLRDDDTYYFATFANFVMVPDIDKFVDEKDMLLPQPLYERCGVKNEVTSVEARLVQAKRLLPKAQARVEMDKANRIHNYLFGRTDIGEHQRTLQEASARRRGQVSDALRGNTAYMNLINRTGTDHDITRLFKENWKPCVTGQPEFSMNHANWLSKGAKGETLNIFDIPSTSDMYVRSEVSIEESLKVGDIQLKVQGKSDWIPQRTVTKVGLYEITDTMEQWCDEKLDALIALRDKKGKPLIRSEILPVFSENKEWINDDSLLIAECIELTKDLGRDTVVALVSKDKRLGNQMSRQANIFVVLIDPVSLVKAFPKKTWNSTSSLTKEELLAAYPKNHKLGRKSPEFVLFDSGSMASSLSNIEREYDESTGICEVYKVESLESGHLKDGKRWEKVKREKLLIPSSLSLLKVFNPGKKDPFRKSKQRFGRDSHSLASYPWTSNDTLQFSKQITRRGGRGTDTISSNPA